MADAHAHERLGLQMLGQSLTSEKAEKLGISDSPEIEYHDWENKSTGRKHKVPKGISPGFEYNVGLHREHKDLQMVTDKLTQVVSQNPEQACATLNALLGDATQKAMIDKVVRDMVADVAEHKRAYGNTLAIGVMDDEVFDKLTKMGKAPHHKIIAVRDTDILHGLRDSKQGKGINLPVEFWQQLPDKLRNPSVVLFQPKENFRGTGNLDTLLFIYYTEKGKLAIKLDYELKIKDKVNKKVNVKLNVIRTGSLLGSVEN